MSSIMLLWYLFMTLLPIATCSNSTSSTSPSLTITLSGSPISSSSRPILNFVLAEEGSNLGLVCRARDPSNPSAQYDLNWFLPDGYDGRVKQRRGQNSFGIELEDLKYSDSGTLKCTAEPSDPYHSEMAEAMHPEPQLVRTIALKVKSSSSFCGPSFFQCPASPRHCIGLRFLCDGVPDCPDGADENVRRCGTGDPCNSKLRCADGRCMDPSLCCDPHMDEGDGGSNNCTFVPACCVALLESNRHFFQLGRDSRTEEDLRFLHSTIFTVIGCIIGLICLVIIVTTVICRLQMRRHVSGLHGSRRPPLSLHDLDLYFAALQGRGGGGSGTGASSRGGRGGQRGRQHSIGITYNINNGVQFVAAPPPPPYDGDPPPPYEIAREARENDANGGAGDNVDAAAPANIAAGAVQDNANDDVEVELEDDDNNNNGDINGNSDLVNQNIVAAEEEARQLLFNNPRVN